MVTDDPGILGCELCEAALEHALSPRILLTVSRRWTDRAAIIDTLGVTVDSLIRREDRIGPVVLVHACRADPVADARWRRWHELRPDWFAEPVIRRTVESLDRSTATVCLAFILNGSRVPTAVAELAQAAGIPVRVVRAGVVA